MQWTELIALRRIDNNTTCSVISWCSSHACELYHIPGHTHTHVVEVEQGVAVAAHAHAHADRAHLASCHRSVAAVDAIRASHLENNAIGEYVQGCHRASALPLLARSSQRGSPATCLGPWRGALACIASADTPRRGTLHAHGDGSNW